MTIFQRNLLFGIAAAVGVAFLLRKQFASFNEGTPFEGTGPIGTLGNAADAATGGVLSNIGSGIGGLLADVRDAVVGDGEINCNDFNRNTPRGEDLYQRCIRGEL